MSGLSAQNIFMAHFGMLPQILLDSFR